MPESVKLTTFKATTRHCKMYKSA